MKTKTPPRSNPDSESATKEINAILATAPKDHRAALQEIRSTIKRLVPDAVEAISYSVPAFRYKGKPFGRIRLTKSSLLVFPNEREINDQIQEATQRLQDLEGRHSVSTRASNSPGPLKETLARAH